MLGRVRTIDFLRKVLYNRYRGGSMVSVFDVAKYILEKQGEISTWKLQKLCYYAQAWTLAWSGKPLFSEDFQAWSNGPVCPELFKSHQGKFCVDKDTLAHGDSSTLNEDERENVDIILRDYGEMEPYELKELTHSEDPWKMARGDLVAGEKCTNIITKSAMGEYYGSL